MDPRVKPEGDAQFLLCATFPILCMDTFLGGGAGEAGTARDGGANKRAGGAGDGSKATNGGA
ncbi:hypothetical protein MNBD_ALPHA12-2172 [hydrothermal vent metagenome]|uniref:Uncharacterized protein n=1 Tax=hydrothermal vent metagenome TaxID=652676 RepID=A0A3B0U2B8_9ZZZZ